MSTGLLKKKCCCKTGCNACSVPVASLTLIFTGMGGSAAQFNGTYTVNFFSDQAGIICQYINAGLVPDPRVTCNYNKSTQQINASLQHGVELFGSDLTNFSTTAFCGRQSIALANTANQLGGTCTVFPN